jgi:hypothetical protein
MPSPEALGQTAPLATVLGDVKNGIEYLKIRQADVATLPWQTVFDQVILGFGDFHFQCISSFLL